MNDNLTSFTGGSGITGLLMVFQTINVGAMVEVVIFGFLGGLAGLLAKELYGWVKYKVLKVERKSK